MSPDNHPAFDLFPLAFARVTDMTHADKGDQTYASTGEQIETGACRRKTDNWLLACSGRFLCR
jgi:hypothetical protein